MKHRHKCIFQQQPRFAHIFNQPLIVPYWKEKSPKEILVRAYLPSSRRIQSQKVVNKEAILKGLFSNQRENYIWSSASNTLSLRLRISHRNSNEQTKLVPDHLLTALAFVFTSKITSFSRVRQNT